MIPVPSLYSVTLRLTPLAANPASVASKAELGTAVAVDGIVGLASSVDSSYLGLECEVWDSTKTTLRGHALITVVGTNELKYKNIGAAALDAADNDVFIVVGNAHGEGTEAPDSWADELKVVYNTTQIFKTPLQITGTLEAAALRGESSELARLRLQKSQEHKIQKERAFLFGGSIVGTGLADSRDSSSTETFTDGHRTDVNGNGDVDFEEFLILMDRKIKDQATEEEVRNAFRHFDRDGTNFITAKKL